MAVRAVKHWNKLSTVVVKSPFLEIVKTWLDIGLTLKLTQPWRGGGSSWPLWDLSSLWVCCPVSLLHSEQPSPGSADAGTSSEACRSSSTELRLWELPHIILSLISIFSFWEQCFASAVALILSNIGPASTVTVFWKNGGTEMSRGKQFMVTVVKGKEKANCWVWIWCSVGLYIVLPLRSCRCFCVIFILLWSRKNEKEKKKVKIICVRLDEKIITSIAILKFCLVSWIDRGTK